MNEEVVKILETAKEILESELEWCQGKLYGYASNASIKKVSACAIGACHIALNRIYSKEEMDCIAAAQALRCLYTNVPPQFKQSPITEFNDDPNTTKEDVLLMFKRAIEEASK